MACRCGNPKRVEVRWVDSWAHARWESPSLVRGAKGATCVSVGFLVDDNDDAITIAQSVGEGIAGVDEYGQPLTIPRAALLSKPRVLR